MWLARNIYKYFFNHIVSNGAILSCGGDAWGTCRQGSGNGNLVACFDFMTAFIKTRHGFYDGFVSETLWDILRLGMVCCLLVFALRHLHPCWRYFGSGHIVVKDVAGSKDPAMSEQDFVGRVIGAASQGAVGALVAASLSAVTEPLVNNMLVKRVPLMEAVKALDPEMIKKFLQTTLATNFIKFPFFEATNIIMQGVDLPPTARGAALGSVFCTITLPITNYRFRKSMNLPVTPGNLYQAYGPTVLRDIIYGIARNKVSVFLTNLNPTFASTMMGRVVNMFATVVAACVLSAPGNELRGYCLQPPDRKQSFGDFFQPAKFIRSTSVGAIIMGISLAIGTMATPQVEKMVGIMKEYLQKNPLSYVLIILFVLQQVIAMRRQSELVESMEKKKWERSLFAQKGKSGHVSSCTFDMMSVCLSQTWLWLFRYLFRFNVAFLSYLWCHWVFNKHQKSVCVTTNIHQQQENPCEVSLCRKVYLVFILGTTLCPEMGRTSTCWSVGRQPGVRELLLKHLRKKQGCRSAKTFFTFYSSFCQAKLRPGVLENYATKDSMIGIQKEQLFPRQFGKSSSFAIFPRHGSWWTPVPPSWQGTGQWWKVSQEGHSNKHVFFFNLIGTFPDNCRRLSLLSALEEWTVARKWK